MSVHSRMLLCTVCIGLTLVTIIVGVIDFPFSEIAQTICGVVVLLCLLALFVSIDNRKNDDRNGSLIINDADEVYLALDEDISKLREKSHVNLMVYLSHSA